MITDRIGRHEVLSWINHNYNKICDILGFFKIKTQEIPRSFVTVKTAIKVRTCNGMTSTKNVIYIQCSPTKTNNKCLPSSNYTVYIKSSSSRLIPSGVGGILVFQTYVRELNFFKTKLLVPQM